MDIRNGNDDVSIETESDRSVTPTIGDSETGPESEATKPDSKVGSVDMEIEGSSSSQSMVTIGHPSVTSDTGGSPTGSEATKPANKGPVAIRIGGSSSSQSKVTIEHHNVTPTTRDPATASEATTPDNEVGPVVMEIGGSSSSQSENTIEHRNVTTAMGDPATAPEPAAKKPENKFGLVVMEIAGSSSSATPDIGKAGSAATKPEIGYSSSSAQRKVTSEVKRIETKVKFALSGSKEIMRSISDCAEESPWNSGVIKKSATEHSTAISESVEESATEYSEVIWESVVESGASHAPQSDKSRNESTPKRGSELSSDTSNLAETAQVCDSLRIPQSERYLSLPPDSYHSPEVPQNTADLWNAFVLPRNSGDTWRLRRASHCGDCQDSIKSSLDDYMDSDMENTTSISEKSHIDIDNNRIGLWHLYKQAAALVSLTLAGFGLVVMAMKYMLMSLLCTKWKYEHFEELAPDRFLVVFFARGVILCLLAVVVSQILVSLIHVFLWIIDDDWEDVKFTWGPREINVGNLMMYPLMFLLVIFPCLVAVGFFCLHGPSGLSFFFWGAFLGGCLGGSYQLVFHVGQIIFHEVDFAWRCSETHAEFSWILVFGWDYEVEDELLIEKAVGEKGAAVTFASDYKQSSSNPLQSSGDPPPTSSRPTTPRGTMVVTNSAILRQHSQYKQKVKRRKTKIIVPKIDDGEDTELLLDHHDMFDSGTIRRRSVKTAQDSTCIPKYDSADLQTEDSKEYFALAESFANINEEMQPVQDKESVSGFLRGFMNETIHRIWALAGLSALFIAAQLWLFEVFSKVIVIVMLICGYYLFRDFGISLSAHMYPYTLVNRYPVQWLPFVVSICGLTSAGALYFNLHSWFIILSILSGVGYIVVVSLMYRFSAMTNIVRVWFTFFYFSLLLVSYTLLRETALTPKIEAAHGISSEDASPLLIVLGILVFIMNRKRSAAWEHNLQQFIAALFIASVIGISFIGSFHKHPPNQPLAGVASHLKREDQPKVPYNEFLCTDFDDVVWTSGDKVERVNIVDYAKFSYLSTLPIDCAPHSTLCVGYQTRALFQDKVKNIRVLAKDVYPSSGRILAFEFESKTTIISISVNRNYLLGYYFEAFSVSLLPFVFLVSRPVIDAILRTIHLFSSTCSSLGGIGLETLWTPIAAYTSKVPFKKAFVGHSFSGIVAMGAGGIFKTRAVGFDSPDIATSLNPEGIGGSFGNIMYRRSSEFDKYVHRMSSNIKVANRFDWLFVPRSANERVIGCPDDTCDSINTMTCELANICSEIDPLVMSTIFSPRCSTIAMTSKLEQVTVKDLDRPTKIET